MKKKLKFIPLLFLSLTTFGLVVSCNPTTSAPVDGEITGVEIGGASTVDVGSTIKLVADVLGTDNDDVIWSSEDETIATVDNSGNVLGISEGTVNIIAKSAAEPQYSASKTITVILKRADNISISVEENEYVTKENDILYNVNLGRTANIKINISPSSARTPDNISFEVIPPSDYVSSAFELVQNPNDITSATFTPFATAEAVSVKVTANYTGYTTAPLVSTIVFNVVDPNADSLNSLNSIIAQSKEQEMNNTVSVLVQTSELENDVETNYNHYQGFVYSDASYGSDSNTKGDTIIYSGIHDSTYYAFKTNSDKQVTNIYSNEAANSNDERIKFVPFERDDVIVYGYNSKVDALFNDAANVKDEFISFAETYAYINAQFTVNEGTILVTSNFVHPISGYTYSLEFNAHFGASNQISLYTFTEVITTDETTLKLYEVCEVTNGDRPVDNKNDNLHYINVENYFLQSFDLSVCNDKTDQYNYSDTTKYGPESIEVLSSGIKKYTVNKNKSLVLKVLNTDENSLVSLYIDRINCSTTDAKIVPAPQVTGTDIFTINPYSDPATSELTLGEATLTFTSKNGFTVKIVVEFIDVSLSKVFTTNVPEGNDFGSIFKGSTSNYFYINTEPDEDVYTYELVISKGEQDGISLIRHEYDNPFGYPGFSYSIVGNEIGSYEFKIKVSGFAVVTEETYKISVKEVYSTDYLTEALVNSGVKFQYSTGTLTSELEFISTNSFKLTTTMLGTDPMTVEIGYHFEEGRIVIDETTQLPDGLYFKYIKNGDIYFNDELTQLDILFSFDEGENPTHFSPYTFKKVIDKSDLPSIIQGNSYDGEVFILGKGYLTSKLTFTNNSGTFAILNANGSELYKATFNYTYDKPATALMLTDIVNVVPVEGFSLDDEIYFHTSYERLEVKLYTDSYSYEKIYFSL